MLIELHDIEPEARGQIAAELRRVDIMRDLQLALDEREADAVDFDAAGLVDVEVKAGAGFFYGLACEIDCGRFPKTFWLCFQIYAALLAEIDFRRTPAGSAQMN